MPSELDAKRDAKIAEKEAARKEKNAQIAAEKKAKAAGREEEGKAKAAEEEAKKKEAAEIDKKRGANVKGKEAARKGAAEDAKDAKAGGSSKYSKRDVFQLKAVFDEYDNDKSGSIALQEFMFVLKKKKTQPRPGEKSDLATRQAAQGVSILDLSENVFHEMDTDGDGEVTFSELLKLMYKFATEQEIKVMLDWVKPPPEPEPEEKPGLSADGKKQILQIFKMYDKDKNGQLSKKELIVALEKTGLDKEEVTQYFQEFDTDGSDTIDKDEFLKLMESTGAFDDM